MPAKKKSTTPTLPSALPPGIGRPALRALEDAGLSTLGQLAKRRESELARLHGVGPKALRILRDALRAGGASFAKEG
jgi:predicted flap endonuclease-1-like 5' DNA nuclease